MTAKFDAFKTALEALCIEHGVRITGSRDYDDYSSYLEVASDRIPAECEIEFVECEPLTPEQQAEMDREEAEKEERRQAARARNEEIMKKRAEWMASPEFAALCAENQRNANRSRDEYMRISTDPTDPAYIDDRPRRVWLNDVKVIDWTVADEFRRCVVTPSGVMHGSVLIERLPGDASEPVAEPVQVAPTGLSGVFVVVPDTPSAVEAPAVAPAATPSYAAPVVKVTPKQVKSKHRKERK